jgi:predicted RNA-binding protein with EMAP domain
MPHDTTKDPRILVAQRCCKVLQWSLKQKSKSMITIAKDRLARLVPACDSAVMTLMYMYQEPDVLISSKPVEKLTATAATLREAYHHLIASRDDQSLLRANIRWCIRIFQGLPQRLANSGLSLAAGIDLVVVKVQSKIKQGNFYITRVSDGSDTYAVVTNLNGIRLNHKVAAAFLPPRDIGGTVSEAMFLGLAERSEVPGTLLEESQTNAAEAAAILFEEVKKSHK